MRITTGSSIINRLRVQSLGCNTPPSLSIMGLLCYMRIIMVKTHGLSHTRIWSIRVGIRQRCYNKNISSYYRYGGRGIKVCKSWHSFENFFNDMKEGYADDLTIDRIDNNKGYSKNNCRWVDMKEQNRNRRDNTKIKGKTIGQWAEEVGLPKQTIANRYYSYGRCREDCLSTDNHNVRLYKGKNITEWSKEVNIPMKTLSYRINNGRSREKALNTPLLRKRNIK